MLILNVLFALLIGAFAGRLMAIVVYYLPKILLEDLPQSRPRDVFNKFFEWRCCRQCQQSPTTFDRLPILGYLLSKNNRCHCENSFAKRSFLFELSIAIVFVISTLLFPFGPTLLFIFLATCLLICCFFTDLEHGILPDELTLSLIWVGLIGSLYPILISSQDAILGAVGGYGIFWALNAIYRFFRNQEGMYPGDFKLNAGIGACIGFKWMMIVLLLSLPLLLVTTFIQMLIQHRFANAQEIYATYLYKEVPYACSTSIVAMIVLYILTLQLPFY